MLSPLRYPYFLNMFFVFNFSFSRICSDRESLVKEAVELAGEISKKSPVAVSGIKHNLIYSREHSAKDGMEYTVSLD